MEIQKTYARTLPVFPIFKQKTQCWTEGRSSTAVAEDLGLTAMVAEVLGHSYGGRFSLVVFLGSSKMEAEMCFPLHRCHLKFN